MKALVLHAPGKLELMDVDDPVPSGEWVRIKVRRVGICGTDKAFYKGTYKPLKQPIIPGHEISGVIDMVGDKAPYELIGHKVTTEINIHCRQCWYCRNGMPTHCPYRETIGISRDGGMAEYVLTRYDLVHITDDLDFDELALIEPFAAVVEMIEMEPVREGSNIAVLGIGTIGLLSIQLLKLYNPDKIIAITRPDSPKAKYAYMMGADEVLSFEEAGEYMEKYTPEGQGFDYVVEATGSPKGLEMALKLVRPRGVIATKSTHGSRVSFDYTYMIVKEVRLIGSRCGPFDKALKIVRTHNIKLKELVTEVYPLEKGVEAFKASFRRENVKVQIEV